MVVPFIDLKSQYEEIRDGVEPVVKEIYETGRFVLGERVEEFEKRYAKHIGSNYCVGVASGRDALLLLLKALGVGPGDEVITVANTFIATVFPIIDVGAKPVLVDIDPETYEIDPREIEKKITKKTKAIIPVHLYGYPAEMDEIMRMAKKYKLIVVEDACQAHGSWFNKKKCGSFGDGAAFSFYPAKNMGASGDAGAVTTNKKTVSEMIKILRDVGQRKKYYHDYHGYNSRLDALHAAFLTVKLKKLDKWNKMRRRVARWYRRELEGGPVDLPIELDSKHGSNYHLFVVRAKRRDELMEFLKEKQIYCGIHYPIPVHLQKSMKGWGYKRGSFPVTERYAKEILSLPMFPHMTGEQVKYVSKSIRKFFNQ
jgi:dTDP-4-amino-4,6-dideoxygalactose transaminase